MKDTKQKIIDTAIEIFNDDYSSALEKVAERAEVTRRTLHRYFTDRNDLLKACHLEMQLKCKTNITHAIESSEDPLIQLERVLYASIDCGSKYAFFQKLHQYQGHQHQKEDEDCATYDQTFSPTTAVIKELQKREIISPNLTLAWINLFMSGIITATIQSSTSGAVAKNDINSFAWFSFSNGIGINKL
ncbi:TetR/AcrR family transcriptional regulator [Pedobacter cryoconitis]|uniref:TetR family transcriptional regulator n=1 Tax=Pedobacter cryoconitis TaxID=188932 RepID=A0A327TD77_9SPHI|nr:TetR/AcrR family transcriptional regulator [Pedobacter cryoconitis]RAJ35787.1 TetR family transcriptional regulator [Pedobacter cryoconitis]